MNVGQIQSRKFVLFFEKSILRGEAIGNWFDVLGEDGTRYGD